MLVTQLQGFRKVKMENSLGSAIEKIKREEQNKEAKLKAKREVEAARAATDRSIREVLTQVKKLQQEKAELIKKTDQLRAEVAIQKIRRDALSSQLKDSNQQFIELNAKGDQAVSEIQELRSTFCKIVQEISDECDIWALLTKPSTEPLPQSININHEEENKCKVNEDVMLNEARLKNAMERREKAIAERERLKSEPDTGEEFMRIYYQTRSIFTNKTQRNTKIEEINENEPIKFSTSPAAQKTVKPIKKIDPDHRMPWYQPYSVVGSITVFLLYFCVFREENDVDMQFTKTLYDRIKGLEKEQLLQTYKFNKEHGKSVADIETRLKELEIQEQDEKLVLE